MDNLEIAKILDQIADLMDIKGENKFKIGAYRKAARAIEELSENINEIYLKDKLKEIPGVGESIEKDIKELIKKRTCQRLKNLKEKIPVKLSELMKIEGLGPKKVAFLYKKFKITTIPQLEKLIGSLKLRKLFGWGEKSEQNILEGIKLYKRFKERFPLGQIYPYAISLKEKLKKSPFVLQIEICGSFRRRKETIGDLDILVTSKNPKKIIDFFVNLPEIQKVNAKGTTKVNVLLKHGPETDLRVVKPESFGAALHYFTGSKTHNIQIRKMGMERGLRINEYGVFKIKNQKSTLRQSSGLILNKAEASKIKNLLRIGGREEEDVFKAVGLPWIPPEIRENEGEIEAAQKNNLPKLIKEKDIKGDLHIHSDWSDGENSLLEIAKACQKRGYQYIAITDHSSPLGITNSLSPSRILKQIKTIKEINKKLRNFYILSGIEVDINKDGSIFLPDKILEKFDLVVAGVHSSFRLPKEQITKRVIRAMQNLNIDILAHPTGQLINEREPYLIDFEAVIKEAQKTKTILEINAFWSRLDLNALNARKAKENGVKLAISTDSHSLNHLDFITFGVDTARRGWIEKKNVINTLPLNELLKFLKRKASPKKDQSKHRRALSPSP